MKDTFLKLVTISSPSGHEYGVAKFITEYLARLKISSHIDANGNVIAHIGNPKPSILLVSHMDTVQQLGEIIRPKLNQGKFTSDGTTILGADNKSGVTILLEIVKHLVKENSTKDISFAFTTNEEAGVMGASKLPIPLLKPQLIINVDGNKDPGVVDVKALGQLVFEICIMGKSSHAAIEPQKGIHAIGAAAKLINKLKNGKNNLGDTFNIGTIQGGKSTNIVPDTVVIQGEIRSFKTNRLEHKFRHLIQIANKVSKKSGAKITVKKLMIGVPVWEKSNNTNIIQKLNKAAKKAGLIFRESEMHASSDANCLANFGIPVVSVNRGGKNPHALTESITLSEMQKTKGFLLKIIDEFQN